jgi:hypothetical protein
MAAPAAERKTSGDGPVRRRVYQQSARATFRFAQRGMICGQYALISNRP